MASNVGPMTNSERNSASPTSTWFGGTDCVPMALRTRDSTTTIFVNAVHMSRIAGATPSTVMSAMIETTWLGWPGTFTDTDGWVGACGPVGLAGASGPVAPGAATAAFAGRTADVDAAGAAADTGTVAAAGADAAGGRGAAAENQPAAGRGPPPPGAPPRARPGGRA